MSLLFVQRRESHSRHATSNSPTLTGCLVTLVGLAATACNVDKPAESAIEPHSDSEQSGWVTVGHEVRAFAPCDSDKESWLLGRSPALPDIRSSYEKTTSGARPYAPLFMALTGRFMDPPHDGFGANYDSAFFATKLIDVKPAGNCRDEFISIEAPTPGAVIESPLLIKGRARGTWFFEGDFPVVLEDVEGNELSRSFVTAEGAWMTKEFVPFTGTLSFTNPVKGLRGRLIFKKDNPTDRPELDDSTAIPVIVAVGSPMASISPLD